MLDFSKHQKLDLAFEDEEYEEFLNDYRSLERRYDVERTKMRGDGLIVVEARTTEKYRYRGYRGTAKTKLIFVVDGSSEAARIKRLESTTKL